jgi:hypothetical protein
MVDRWRDGGSGLAIRCCHGAVINSTSSDSKNQTQILQLQQRQDTCRYSNSSKGKTRADTPTAAKARHVQIRQQQQRQDTCRYSNSSKGKTRADTPTAAKARHVRVRCAKKQNYSQHLIKPNTSLAFYCCSNVSCNVHCRAICLAQKDSSHSRITEVGQQSPVGLSAHPRR